MDCSDCRSEDVLPFRDGSCWHCGEPGHYFFECPGNKDACQEAAEMPPNLVYRALRYEEDPLEGLKAVERAPFRSINEAISNGSRVASPYLHSSKKERVALNKYCSGRGARTEQVWRDQDRQVERIGSSSRLLLLKPDGKRPLNKWQYEVVIKVRCRGSELTSCQMKRLTHIRRGDALTIEGARVAVIDLDKLPGAVGVYDGVEETAPGTRERRFATADKEIVIAGIVPPHAVIAVWCKERVERDKDVTACSDGPDICICVDDHWHEQRRALRETLRGGKGKVECGLLDFAVAGVTHYQSAVRTLAMDQWLILFAESNNPHDQYAVSVNTLDGQNPKTIGFVPRLLTHKVRRALVDGASIGKVTDIKIGLKHSTGVNVRVKVWLPKVEDCVRVRSSSLKAWCHDGLVTEIKGQSIKVSYEACQAGIEMHSRYKWLEHWSHDFELVMPASLSALRSAESDTSSTTSGID